MISYVHISNAPRYRKPYRQLTRMEDREKLHMCQQFYCGPIFSEQLVFIFIFGELIRETQPFLRFLDCVRCQSTTSYGGNGGNLALHRSLQCCTTMGLCGRNRGQQGRLKFLDVLPGKTVGHILLYYCHNSQPTESERATWCL